MRHTLQRLAFLAFFTPSLAFALVDMRNANYSDTWVDLQVKGAAYDLRVQRTYNSRTLFSGIFGFGWCSDFETTLKVTAENALRITECGAGFEIDYTPSNFDKGSTEKNIGMIMTEVRKRNKGRDEAYFKGVEQDIRLDSALRDEFAKQLNMTGKVAENSRYIANGRTNDFIVLKGTEYTRTLTNGTYQKFDKAGHMIQMSDKNGNYIKIAYRADKIISVTDNTGASLQFKFYDNTKFVKQVNGPGALVATYKYKGENLIEISNAWKNTFKHEYDDLYNMTKATYPDGSFVALTYDKDKDWVTSFRDRRGCKETYAYSDSETDPLNNYKSDVKKVCDGKTTNTSSYEFWHKTRTDGSRYLARSKSVNNGHSVETTYHEVFGRPVEIVEDGSVSRFEYFTTGLLKKKTDPARVYNYKYENPCSKVSQVSVVTSYQPPGTGKDRKPSKVETRTLTTDFLYEPKRCNLMGAKNTDGQVVQLEYDMRGRIRHIVDQSKKEVAITYEDRFGKPYIVSRPGLGTIKFKYKNDGSLDKFDSDEDPLVAVQVASIFSNLLEVIAPATTETNNI